MRLEVGKYYKNSYETRGIFGDIQSYVMFFGVNNVDTIAGEDTITYVGFTKEGNFYEEDQIFTEDNKITEISPADFYKAYNKYYVPRTKKRIKQSSQEIENAKEEYKNNIEDATKEEKKLLAGLDGIVTYFQKPSIKELEVKDGQGTE